jgi:hypothetical protein
MTIIDIHEFSTGINVKGTKDSWYSHGFTGPYLNSTIANIPKPVGQEIAADLFELAESSIQQTPAIIGREVELDNEKWSVLAVVNSAWDESKRWITVTRFFITEGLGKLNDLITYQQTNNLKFDPFDQKQLNQPNKYNTSNTKETGILPIVFDDYSSVVNNLLASPLILSSRLTNKNQKIPIKAIHQLAQEKAKISSSSKLITWAYNVEGLKKPHDFLVDFLVIYSASPQADQYLQQSFQVKQRRVERKEGEHQILTIIRNWINQADVQQNDIPIINNALLSQSQYDSDFWDISIFDQLGIDDSQGKSRYRLWLLHSLVFSNVSEELLSLYNDKSKDKQYQQEVQELSHNIQLYLSRTLQLAIQSHAFQCVNVAVTNLVSDSKTLGSTVNWLTSDKENNGIFGTILKIGYIELLDQEFNRLYLNKKETIQYILNYYYHQQNYKVSEQNITENLEHLNQLIFNVWGTGNFDSKSLENLSVLNTENWLSITSVIRKMIWLKIDGSGLYEKCQVIAEFFEKISQSPASNRISALFYHLSQGKIPTSVWEKCRFGQTLSLPPELGNLEAIKKLAVSANKNTSTTHSSPASTSDELDSQDSQESTTENETLTLLAILIFWLKLLPFLIKNKELAFVLRSHYQEGTTPVPPPSPVPPSSPVSPNHQTSPTTNRNTKYKAILYGIPVKRKLTLLEKLQRYFGKRFSLLFFGLLFKSHQVPASGLILLALALLAGAAGYQVNNLQVSHCKSPNLASTVISKIPLIGVNCPEPPSPEELTIAALNKIVGDFKEHLKTENAKSQEKIIELLDSTRKTYKLDFQQIELKGWLVFWRSSKIENLSNWTTAIKNYQLQAVEQQKQAKPKINKKLFLNPTGEIEQGDSTDQYLRCELQKDLQLNSKPDKIEHCQKYGVKGLIPDPDNPSIDPSPP